MAMAIRDLLTRMGFEPYIAVDEKSLRGLRENIFPQLQSAEYFLFIDFKREELPGGAGCRGSLFTNQELAIASLLDLEVLAFQEKGVKRLDGMLQALQVNATPFTDNAELLRLIEAEASARWKPDWRAELAMGVHRLPADGMWRNNWSRFLSGIAFNRHARKDALDCNVYLERVRRHPADWMERQPVEAKWGGCWLPSVRIGSGKNRHFDAVRVEHETPRIAHFNTFSDSWLYGQPLEGPGEFGLEYAVYASGFAPVRGQFRLVLGQTMEELQFESIGPPT